MATVIGLPGKGISHKIYSGMISNIGELPTVGWGSITGDLTTQKDLVEYIDDKTNDIYDVGDRVTWDSEKDRYILNSEEDCKYIFENRPTYVRINLHVFHFNYISPVYTNFAFIGYRHNGGTTDSMGLSVSKDFETGMYEGNTVNIEKDVPTKTSQLTNDSGFITSADVPTSTSQLTNDSGYITFEDYETDCLSGAVNKSTTYFDVVASDYISLQSNDIRLEGYITSDLVFSDGTVLTGETLNDHKNHGMTFGYPTHDMMDFYEWGGDFVFHQYQDGSDTVVAEITPSGIEENGELLADKYQGKLIAGANVTISDDNVISVIGGGSGSGITYTAGSGIAISGVTISVDGVTGSDPKVLFINSDRCTDCNDWVTNGYTKTSTDTLNLPSICTGNDRWGVLSYLAENDDNHAGMQQYFPIDGTYKGRIFYRGGAGTSGYVEFSDWNIIPLYKVLTQSEYESMDSYDDATLYLIKE